MKRKQFIKLGIATLLTVISLYTPINLATIIPQKILLLLKSIKQKRMVLYLLNTNDNWF